MLFRSPKEMDAKKVGDTQLEVELKLPADAPRGTNAFVVVSPDGGSEPHSLLVLEPGSLVSEKEPNNGFRQAQEISFGKTIQGVINEAKEVDVFRITGQAGQTIVAEVSAARFGSMLDSILTLYDERGHVLATNDDSETGSDSLLRVKLPASGNYFLSLIDAHDRGGVTFVYQLAVTVEK